MKDFDYIILGGGCSGLSLAYEMQINDKLKTKSLAIIETRDNYQRDKTWSFWRVHQHNFEDCVFKNWDHFTINTKNGIEHKECKLFPYQAIDSGKFYNKVLNKLKQNKNIFFFKEKSGIDFNKSIIFNSIPEIENNEKNLWQHFSGYEIETEKDFFDESIMNLMDFDCDQRNSVHFFYTLPFTKKRALVETTWLSSMTDEKEADYDAQLKNYISKHLNIKNFKIIFKEQGKIPLFKTSNINNKNIINIGTAGGMTRLSTGYTFLNIQQQSRYIVNNLGDITNKKGFKIPGKYDFLDQVFLKVLKKYPKKMPDIFFNMFKSNSKNIINFLSNKSNFFEDMSIILRMPKMIFLKALFEK